MFEKCLEISSSTQTMQTNPTPHEFLRQFAQFELLSLLRRNGLTEKHLNHAEYNSVTMLVLNTNVPPKQRIRQVETIFKQWLIRQIRESHSPVDTALYLQFTFHETLVYLMFMIFWLPVIHVVQSAYLVDAPWIVYTVRLIMTVHLGYYNIVWLYCIFKSIKARLKSVSTFIIQLTRVLPLFIWELSSVIFEVFIGWPLITSLAGLVLSMYLIPFVYPYMRLSSIVADLYIAATGSTTLPVWLNLFCILF